MEGSPTTKILATLMCRFSSAVWILIVFLSAISTDAAKDKSRQQERLPDVQFSGDEFKMLDTFEAHRLTKADAAFQKGDTKQARSEYDSFMLEFPKSRATAYVLIRKAQSLHLDNDRFNALKTYQEVLDYFPNVVQYAAPASYLIGLAHWNNGDTEKAVKAWAQMVSDPEYSRHPLGASALNYLAQHFAKNNQLDDAIRYYSQVATTFRISNGEAANAAIQKTLEYYIRSKPDEPALRAFYKQVKTFDRNPQKVPEDLDADPVYWNEIREGVKRFARFTPEEKAFHDRCFRYWASALEKRFPNADDFQIDVAAFHLAYEEDTQKWMTRLDQLFSRNQKPENYDRVIKWIRIFAQHKTKAMEYYAKLDLARLKVTQMIELMRVIYDNVRDERMGRNLFDKLPVGDLSDPQKVDLARYFWKKDPAIVKDLCMVLQDKDLGKAELMRFYAGTRECEKGIAQSEEVSKIPAYAKEALETRADLLFHNGQYEKAISAYQQCSNQPNNLWRIADCLVKLNRIEQAIGQLREVENFLKDFSAEAALRIAGVYKHAGQNDQHIAALRAVMKKYPKSPQSNSAHQELERLGVRIGGGVDADN